MSDDDERSSGKKKTFKGYVRSIFCVRCRNLLTRPIMLIDTVGNVCSRCFKEMKAACCSCRPKSPSIIFPLAVSSSGHETISDPADVIFEPPARNPPPQRARVDGNMEPVPSTSRQGIEHICPNNCKCYDCKKKRAELSPILEGGTTSEEDSTTTRSPLVQCVVDVHRANNQEDTQETVTSGELTTSEPCPFEEVVDIVNSAEAETIEPAATVYSDDRPEPPVIDRRLVPQDSSSSNEPSEPTETTTVETPEDFSQDQRSQQIEVLPVENNTEQSNSEAEDVIDAVRIVNAPECSVPVREDPTHKKAEESELELVCEDNSSEEMSTETLSRDVPEGPVRPSVSKSDESEPLRRIVRDEIALDVETRPEDERKESQPSDKHEAKKTTIEKFGAEKRKLESSDDEPEGDEKSHDHRRSEEQESSKLEEEESASAQKKSESKKYDGEKFRTEKEKDELLADEESEEESEEGSSAKEQSTDSKELKDESDIPSDQKAEKFESKEGDGGSSADDLLGEEESEEVSDDDDKISKTEEDDVASHREESTTEEKGVDREEVVSTKEKESGMKSPEVKGISEGEESDDKNEFTGQEGSSIYAEKEESKYSEREYGPLEEEDTSEGDGSDSRKKDGKREEESERESKNVESPKEEQECPKEKTTRYDRLTESETEDEKSNGNAKKDVRDAEETKKIVATEEGGSSQDKFSEKKKASERGTSEVKGSKQRAGEKEQQESSSTRDKEQISCKKSPAESKDLAEKEESSDVTESRDTVLMIIERHSPPREPATMEKVRTLYGIENIALADIMETFTFECENYILGCRETFSPEEWVAHKESCLFQTAHCEFEDCIWTGTLKEYTRHFLRHTDLKKLQAVDDRFDLPNWNSQDSTYILQTSGGYFILNMRILEDNLFYLIYDLRRTVRNVKFDLVMEYYGKSGAKLTFRCNITRSVKLNCFDELKATAIDLDMLNSYIPLEDNPCMSIYAESDDPCFCRRTTSINLLKCKKCGLYMDSPIKQCTYGHYVCGSCYQNVKECPQCDTSLLIVDALNKWKDNAKYVCKFDLGKEVDLNRTTYHESLLCTFHPWPCPKCPESELKPLLDYFDLIDHMQGFHRIPVLANSESIKKLGQLSYEIYFIQFSKLFLFKSVYLEETDTSEFYVIYIGPKQDRYRFEIGIKYKKGVYTKYMSLSCECAYNKSNEILRKEPQEAEQITPVNAMSPAEVYISPDSSDLLSKKEEEVTKGSSVTGARSSLPQISGTQTLVGKLRYLTSQTHSNVESQTPTSKGLPYSEIPSPEEMVKQNTNQKIAMLGSQEIQRRSIGSTVQESPKPADTPGIMISPQMTTAAIPENVSPELSANIESKSLIVKGKGETDEGKLIPEEGIVIQNGLERFGERFEFNVKITRIMKREFS